MQNIFYKYKNFLFVVIPFGVLWAIKPLMPSWFFIPPKSCLGGCGSIEGMIPFVGWINTGIKFLKSYEIFGLFTFRELTRSISKGINDVAFDKGKYKYHGLIKILADAARTEGLNF